MKNRLKKRKSLNRYDKFDYNFYENVQKGFMKIIRKKPTRYMEIDSNLSINYNKKIILKKINRLLGI